MTDIKEKIVIGIDIGTHSSCVSFFRNDVAEIFANENGNRTTPSVVAYLPNGEIIIGDEASGQMARNTANTIYDSKRLIGRSFADSSADIKRWPFTVVDIEERPHYLVQHDNKQKQITPEAITSIVLRKLKEIAETGIHKKVTHAVITVPAHYSDDQRKIIKGAAANVGLTVQRFITEPVAVVLGKLGNASGSSVTSPSLSSSSSDIKAESTASKNILVFDLGGGGLSVAIVRVHQDLLELSSHVFDPSLGGENFDDLLVEYFATDFKRRFKRELKDNARALARVRVASERAKKNLSTMAQTTIDLDGLYEGMDFNSAITRARFEDIAYSVIRSCLVPITSCLSKANMTKDQITEIIMAGGGSRIPAIQKLVSDYFNGKEIKQLTNPEEAAVEGAAVEGYHLRAHSSDHHSKQAHPRTIEVQAAPNTIGISGFDGKMQVMISKNTLLPAKKKIQCSTSVDDQSSLFVQVYEGEHSLASENKLIARYEIAGIKNAPKGTPKITISFSLDTSGTLNITAEDKASGVSSKLEIKH
eukprot:TRINITY_DN119_c0_g1_i1.p2 TRINITY_DN119_c0_g1~~TRINITY_DN119_c0_g1_i1.p2  ORF type:complete len:532 (-),score=181.63 TRINITY_DN119_c0_g1_i1:166-1761(-)